MPLMLLVQECIVCFVHVQEKKPQQENPTCNIIIVCTAKCDQFRGKDLVQEVHARAPLTHTVLMCGQGSSV